MASKLNADTPSGLTDTELKVRLRDAIRKVWRRSARAKFIRSIRFPYPQPSRFKWAVRCENCGATFGVNEKVTYRTRSGRRRRTSVYHVDHIHDVHPLTNIEEDFGKHTLDIINNEFRILCVSCHLDRTLIQRKNKKR